MAARVLRRRRRQRRRQWRRQWRISAELDDLAGRRVPALQPISTPCAWPRAPGTTDRLGTVTDQNNWLRSWTNEMYLWYGEVADRDPSLYATDAYFNLLKTTRDHGVGRSPRTNSTSPTTPTSGRRCRRAVSRPATARNSRCSRRTPPRRIVVAYTDPGTTAATNLARGDEILQVDGADAVNGNTQADVDALNAGLFPDNTGESHTFVVRNTAGVHAHRDDDVRQHHARCPCRSSRPSTRARVRSATSSSTITSRPPRRRSYDAINDAQGRERHRPDPRHALQRRRLSRYRQRARLHDRQHHADRPARRSRRSSSTTRIPSRNPVTGEILAPTPFHVDDAGLPPARGRQPAAADAQPRTACTSSPGPAPARRASRSSTRCAAWASQVYLIGSTTCGKPYGFYPTDNCGTTYFTIQFRGENAANFGDYTDGFSPANTTARRGHDGAGLFGRRRFHASDGRRGRRPHRRGAGVPREQQPDVPGRRRAVVAAAAHEGIDVRRLRTTAACGSRSPRHGMNRIMRRMQLNTAESARVADSRANGSRKRPFGAFFFFP